MPDSGIADGAVFTSSFYDTYIRQQVVVVCTSGTRPTGVEGRRIYETDTDRELVYNGTSWCIVGGAGAWIAFSGTLTNVTEGNGTKVGFYSRTGLRTIHWYVKFTLGSTSTIGGLIGVALPVTAAADAVAPGIARLHVAGASRPGYYSMASTTRVDLFAIYAANTYGETSNTSATVPATWTTADYFHVGGTYEAATAA